MRDYVFPIRRITNKFKTINSFDQLKNFIKERSAHVTQTTLYGYIKTRIGSRYNLMFDDEVFVRSVNIAKWNIYACALTDLTLYTFSYLTDKKNLKKDNKINDIFFSILDDDIKKIEFGPELYEKTKSTFEKKIKEINWNNYHKDKPFYNSGQALYNWSPISEELKVLDKTIVLNSIKLKWNLVENEFQELTKNVNFD